MSEIVGHTPAWVKRCMDRGKGKLLQDSMDCDIEMPDMLNNPMMANAARKEKELQSLRSQMERDKAEAAEREREAALMNEKLMEKLRAKKKEDASAGSGRKRAQKKKKAAKKLFAPKALGNRTSSLDESASQALAIAAPGLGDNAGTWAKTIDPSSGQEYFYNSVTGETSWSDPNVTTVQ